MYIATGAEEQPVRGYSLPPSQGPPEVVASWRTGHAGELDEAPGRLDSKLRFVGAGFTVDAAPATPQRSPPRLGEHGAEVLAELGYDERAIAELREQGALV